MIWSPLIFQPKLCAIDFSVNKTLVQCYTKFCKGDDIQLQLSIGGEVGKLPAYIAEDSFYIWRGLSPAMPLDLDYAEKIIFKFKFIKENETVIHNVTAKDYINGNGTYTAMCAFMDSFDCKRVECSGGLNDTSVVLILERESDSRIPSYATVGFFVAQGYAYANEDSISWYLKSNEVEQYFSAGLFVPDAVLTWDNFVNTLNPVEGSYTNYANKLMYRVLNEKGENKKQGELSLLNTETIVDDNDNVIAGYYHLGAKIANISLEPAHYLFQVALVNKGATEFDDNAIVADSEIFEIASSAENTILFNFEHYKPLFGCIFGEQINYMFRLSGLLRKDLSEPNDNGDEFSSYDNRNIRTVGYPVVPNVVTIGGLEGIPEPVYFKMYLALQCQSLLINGEWALVTQSQDKLEVINSMQNGNKVFNLKIQSKNTKYISGSLKQGFSLKNGTSPVINNKFV